MLEPIIKPNKKIIAYRAWLSEKWRIGEVTPVKFIEYRYKNYRQTKPYPFTFDGMNFVGEVWECIDKEGNIVNCIFKHYIDNAFKSDSSLTSNKTPILDGFQPNLLMDSYDEYLNKMVNRQKNPNLLLKKQNIQFKKRLDILKQLMDESTGEIKKCCFFILRHKESPTISTLRTVQKIRTEQSTLYNEIINLINEREN